LHQKAQFCNSFFIDRKEYDMNTTFTLVQAAIILGISFQETQRYVRAKQLRAAKRADKVRVVEATELQTFIERRKHARS